MPTAPVYGFGLRLNARKCVVVPLWPSWGVGTPHALEGTGATVGGVSLRTLCTVPRVCHRTGGARSEVAPGGVQVPREGGGDPEHGVGHYDAPFWRTGRLRCRYLATSYRFSRCARGNPSRGSRSGTCCRALSRWILWHCFVQSPADFALPIRMVNITEMHLATLRRASCLTLASTSSEALRVCAHLRRDCEPSAHPWRFCRLEAVAVVLHRAEAEVSQRAFARQP